VFCVVAMQAGRLRPFYRTILTRSNGPRVRWREEMWPMQWRIAISSVSSFFAYNIVTPLAFRLVGPVAAGQLGMTMSLINAMTNTASLPVTLKAPSMGIAIAQRNYSMLDRIALRATLASAGLWLCGAAVLAVGVRLANLYELGIANRLLSEPLFWLWLIASALPVAGTPAATYMRAHKREPIMFVGLVYAFATLIGFLVLGTFWGLLGLAIANVLSLALATPIVVAIMLRSRRRWQKGTT
jgi:O-antigen/teichoic acid export membrane protein